MTEVVVAPDVEAWAVAYLSAALAARPEPYTGDVWVSTAMPVDPVTKKSYRKDRMVIVRDDGGPRLDVVREVARLGVQVWAKTDEDASDLARLVAALLWAAPDGKPVVKASTSGPWPVPDESGQPKRYLTAELVVRCSAL